jgi:hypothetical protein
MKAKRVYVRRNVAWLDPEQVRLFNRDAQRRWRQNHSQNKLKSPPTDRESAGGGAFRGPQGVNDLDKNDITCPLVKQNLCGFPIQSEACVKQNAPGVVS